MGLWLEMEPLDVAAYIVSDILGLLVFLWLRPNIALALTVSIFVSFHLFLAWLVMNADHETGFSLPVVSTIFTHLACLLIVYLCSTLVIALSRPGHFLPFYLWLMLRPIRYILAVCIPGLAVFERSWLFSGGRKKKEVPVTPEVAAIAAETAAAADAATGDDYAEWLRYVERQKKPFPKPGTSLKTEYERWLLARARDQSGVIER
jgi:hypothetical protein